MAIIIMGKKNGADMREEKKNYLSLSHFSID
jgi:hypothetical protein